MVNELRQNGMAIWRGLFADPDLLDQLRPSLNEGFSRWEAIFREKEDSCEDVFDEETQCMYRRGTKEYFESDSRTRVYYQPPRDHTLIQKMRDDPRIREVACRYYQLELVPNSTVLAETLSPSPIGDSWHFDRIRDQLKVMILLSDVGPEHGPMRYKLGTHQKPPPKVDHFFYQLFRVGSDYSYVSPPIGDRAPGEDRLALGRVGDCIFFDTTGLHSGTRCQTGARHALVLFYDQIPSLRNRVLVPLSDGMIL
jgi:hypothetical protein